MNRAIVARAKCGCAKAVEIVGDLVNLGQSRDVAGWLLAGLSVGIERADEWTLPEVCDKCREETPCPTP